MSIYFKLVLSTLILSLLAGCLTYPPPAGMNIERSIRPELEKTRIALIGGIILDSQNELSKGIPQYLAELPDSIIPSLDNKFSHVFSNNVINKNGRLTILSFDTVLNLISSDTIQSEVNELLLNIIMASATDTVVNTYLGPSVKSSAKQIRLATSDIPYTEFKQLCDFLDVDAIAFTIVSNTLEQIPGGYGVYSICTSQVIKYENGEIFSIWDGYVKHESSYGTVTGKYIPTEERLIQMKHYNFNLLQEHIAEDMAVGFCESNLNKFFTYAENQRETPFVMPLSKSDKIYISWSNRKKVTATLNIYKNDGLTEMISSNNGKKGLNHKFEIENIWDLVGAEQCSFRIETNDGYISPLYSIDRFVD